MSKKIVLLSAAILLVFSIAFSGDATWFDMKNCSMCKALNEKPGLLESMSYEQVSIPDGIVSITTVNNGRLKDYREAHAKMMDIAARLQKGEPLPLCQSCTALGAMMMKGVKQNYAETTMGDVWVLTSDTPAVVAELQGWAKHNQDEMAKLEAAKKK